MDQDPAQARAGLAAPHEVLRALAARVAAGSQPGARRDGFRIALAIEGGGMRGAVRPMPRSRGGPQSEASVPRWTKATTWPAAL